jgi:hypothetical protein
LHIVLVEEIGMSVNIIVVIVNFITIVRCVFTIPVLNLLVSAACRGV